MGFVKTIEEIPFLPIQFFKERKIICGNIQPQQVFESSKTTGQTPSKHFVLYQNLSIRNESLLL